MFRLRSILFLLPMFLLLVVSDSEAGLKKRPLSLHLQFGGVQPALNDSAQVWVFSSVLGADLQLMLSPGIGLVGSFRVMDIYNDSVSTSIFKVGKDRANRKWQIRAVSLGPKFYLQPRGGFTPYLTAQADLLFWKVRIHPGNLIEKVPNESDNLVDYSATELGATVGLGFEKVLWERLGLSFGGNLTYLTGVGADFAQSVDNSRSRALLQFYGGLSFNFGFGRKTLREKYEKELSKRDENAVRTVYQGEIDDESGDTIFVDQSRHGRNSNFVPIEKRPISYEDDDDFDGVRNRLDKCPDTPEGALVDREGCPNDSDGDGVLDGIDLCIDTPAEAVGMIDRFGCPKDSDYDGVPDFLDQCPETAAAITVDSVGCPPDRDGDGIDDSFDNCPDTPSGVAVDLRGCPDFEKIFAKRVLSSLFLPGDVKIKSWGKTALDSIAQMLQVFDQVTAIIYGYTDNLGSADANKKVSKRRAAAVVQYLTGKGVAATRLKAVGMGETDFIASNRTRSGRAKNRRVEIEFSYSTNK